jgi:hypothetical protein
VRSDLTQLVAGDGLLTSAAVRSAGVSAKTLEAWLRSGRLRALHRGVYAPRNLVITSRVTARAATLATGRSDAAAGYETAAGVHDIGVLALTGPPHVIVPVCIHRPSRPDLVVHRRGLVEADVVDLDGVRATAVLRTVVDLLGAPGRLAAIWAGEAALRAGAVPAEALDAAVGARSGRPYAARMRQWRALMDPRSESPLETAIRLVLHDAGLPAPEPQYEVRTRDGHVVARIDLAWPAMRLALEADGKEPHGMPRPVYTDRWRTNALVGWRVIRFTWYDVLRRPAYVVATVRAHLAAAA